MLDRRKIRLGLTVILLVAFVMALTSSMHAIPITADFGRQAKQEPGTEYNYVPIEG